MMAVPTMLLARFLGTLGKMQSMCGDVSPEVGELTVGEAEVAV